LRRSKTFLFQRCRLQLLENVASGGEIEGVLRGLLSSVDDLAVVNDEHVAVGAALLVSPANGLGELGIGVGEEQLKQS